MVGSVGWRVPSERPGGKRSVPVGFLVAAGARGIRAGGGEFDQDATIWVPGWPPFGSEAGSGSQGSDLTSACSCQRSEAHVPRFTMFPAAKLRNHLGLC